MPTTSQGGTSKHKRNHTELEDTPETQSSRKRILECTPVQQILALKPPSFKRTHLRIDIPSADRAESPSSLFSALDTNVSPNSDPDSLFDEPNTITDTTHLVVAHRVAPPIPGLFFSSSSAYQLPQELADEVMQKCMDLYFTGRTANQVMLFGRTTTTKTSPSPATGLPPILITLLARLSDILLPLLPPETHTLLFPTPSSSSPPKARQAILNLYKPGDGISPHVDLLRRYGDGILGVSLGSGCVMGFKKQPESNNNNSNNNETSAMERYELYLPEKSVIVLSEDARYKWTHGIEGRMSDLVRSSDGRDTRYIARETRLSITFRWMLPGAEVVGPPDSIDPTYDISV